MGRAQKALVTLKAAASAQTPAFCKPPGIGSQVPREERGRSPGIDVTYLGGEEEPHSQAGAKEVPGGNCVRETGGGTILADCTAFL